MRFYITFNISDQVEADIAVVAEVQKQPAQIVECTPNKVYMPLGSEIR